MPTGTAEAPSRRSDDDHAPAAGWAEPARTPPPLPAHRRFPWWVWCGFALEYVLGRGAIAVLHLLPLDTGARLMSGFAGTFGPLIPASRRIERNIDHVRPDWPAGRRRAVVRGTWQTMALVGFDFISLQRYAAAPDRIEVVGEDVLRAAAADPKGALFFSAHLSTWEIARLAARERGIGFSMVYRAFNNPFYDRYAWQLMWSPDAEIIHKGQGAAWPILRLLRAGRPVMMLVDQRLNEGEPIPFLGKPAMTPTALAEFAIRTGARLVPTRVERTGAARFRVTFEPPLDVPADGIRANTVRRVMQTVNDRLGAWIDERPEQWFWLHRRWAGRASQAERDQPGDQ